ncbi:MAG: hypothetical protein WC088_01735 [Candidatus Izemoplasmatales bacterium]|jgi:hypothetical protein|nr:hypothetical protein [Candidatus Izemoplasmatales bacterium]MDD4595839.1 hypothetical protein [Candidatus Izemoplasmatales bacterium]
MKIAVIDQIVEKRTYNKTAKSGEKAEVDKRLLKTDEKLNQFK